MVKSLMFLLCFICCMCKPKPVPTEELVIDHLKLRKAVQEASGPFTPAKSKDEHVLLKYFIKDDKVVNHIDASMVRVVDGPMPKFKQVKLKKYGGFQVLYKNASDSLLGAYSMKSPLYSRSDGKVKKRVRKISNGSFFVRLPKDTSIVTVILRDGNVELASTDVRAIFIRL